MTTVSISSLRAAATQIAGTDVGEVLSTATFAYVGTSTERDATTPKQNMVFIVVDSSNPTLATSAVVYKPNDTLTGWTLVDNLQLALLVQYILPAGGIIRALFKIARADTISEVNLTGDGLLCYTRDNTTLWVFDRGQWTPLYSKIQQTTWPIGGLMGWSDSISMPDSSWHRCDGSMQYADTAQWQALFAVIGYTFNNADDPVDTGQFRLPLISNMLIRVSL